jgi:hypothetical protein
VHITHLGSLLRGKFWFLGLVEEGHWGSIFLTTTKTPQLLQVLAQGLCSTSAACGHQQGFGPGRDAVELGTALNQAPQQAASAVRKGSRKSAHQCLATTRKVSGSAQSHGGEMKSPVKTAFWACILHE